MSQYTTSRRSAAKTTGYLRRIIQTVFISEDGTPLKLIEIERRGYVTYNSQNGNYMLTDEGRKFLAGGRLQ